MKQSGSLAPPPPPRPAPPPPPQDIGGIAFKDNWPPIEGEEIVFIVIMCVGIVVIGTAAVAAWVM